MTELTGDHTAGFEGDKWSVDWFDDRIEICVKGMDGWNDPFEHRIALDINGSSTIDKMLSEMYRKRMNE